MPVVGISGLTRCVVESFNTAESQCVGLAGASEKVRGRDPEPRTNEPGLDRLIDWDAPTPSLEWARCYAARARRPKSQDSDWMELHDRNANPCLSSHAFVVLTVSSGVIGALFEGSSSTMTFGFCPPASTISSTATRSTLPMPSGQYPE
jgi:hypothetical protein